MTGADELIIDDFESKLNRLMGAYTRLQTENRELREQMNLQSVELDKVRKQNIELTESYKNLKQAKIISGNDSEIGDTKRRLSKLVREVDRCIALLNASEQQDEQL
jgi:predicted  nucleic acid-binding Zn-ribbon protein